MVTKIYYTILMLFVLLILTLNILMFTISGFDMKQLTNLSHMRMRTSSTILLVEHILFESGVFLKEPTQEMIDDAIAKAVLKLNTDPHLIRAFLDESNKKYYFIEMNGAIGAMAILPSDLGVHHGLDPFITDDHIYIGSYMLSKAINEEPNLYEALANYIGAENDTDFQLVDNIINRYILLSTIDMTY